MFAVAVTYLLRDGADGPEVLLGNKLTGIGTGRLVGPGGKLEPGESAEQAAIRETLEEVGVVVSSVVRIAELAYTFPRRPSWSQSSTAFLSRDWRGDPRSSDELEPQWFSVSRIPFDRMWDDARLWLPGALTGRFIRADCSYAADNATVDTFRLLD
ncbi:8-oxo-dGTP diphosphatase [Naasia lichenicola]|uniref:Oxidized purine nucleoside triphosphate hydrolase n=1 Tax=Naasia lichenicola TaxID=2565933 RepID=A0A4V3WTT3_9MICO|nr:NUDIX domain-containing protein [Naasia lichenicola]THG33167.1 NUDIX domain-containing protein [Naasia lichenicola]